MIDVRFGLSGSGSQPYSGILPRVWPRRLLNYCMSMHERLIAILLILLFLGPRVNGQFILLNLKHNDL